MADIGNGRTAERLDCLICVIAIRDYIRSKPVSLRYQPAFSRSADAAACASPDRRPA